MVDAIFVWETWELGYILREMNGRQALYSENDSEPQTGIDPRLVSSEGCGFDPRLGLRIVFWVQSLMIIHLS